MRPLLIPLLALALLAGCGDGGEETASTGDENAKPQKSTSEVPSRGPAKEPDSEGVVAAHCPPGVPDCRTTEGRVIYVERVDPDGDGDAHFVVSDPQSITLPGVTVIDVRKGLRPDPLPGPGDLVSAAGPVQTGSYGQQQIHALEFHAAP